MTNEETIRILMAMKDELILVFDHDRKVALDKAIEALRNSQAQMPGASDLISRCELFNRLANVKDLGEAFAVIQGMPTEESQIIHCRDCTNYTAGYECLIEGVA